MGLVLLVATLGGSAIGVQSLVAPRVEAPPAIVVHVANAAAVPADVLRPAQERAGAIYARAGVSLQWRDADGLDLEWRSSDRASGSVEIFVVLAASRLTESVCRANHISARAMGAAMVRNRRLAYVFTDRIDELARRKSLPGSTILGEVIAHEVGHLLLPDSAHTRDGVMRANVDARLHAPAQFTEQQAEALRARLPRR